MRRKRPENGARAAADAGAQQRPSQRGAWDAGEGGRRRRGEATMAPRRAGGQAKRQSGDRPPRGAMSERPDAEWLERRRDERTRAREGLDESFKCGNCKRFIGPPLSGGRHRNHCPFCLYSRHVDGGRSGDRASDCGALMRPIGAFQRPNGEHVVVHLCLGCGFERFNRIAADDDFDLVLALPVVEPRSARPTAAAKHRPHEDAPPSE